MQLWLSGFLDSGARRAGRFPAWVLMTVLICMALPVLAAEEDMEDAQDVERPQDLEPSQDMTLSQEEVLAKGQAILSEHCARCHAIGPTDASLNVEAPPFRILSENYPVEDLAESLAEGIMSGHPDMPVFVFEPPEVDAIIVYLESIQVQPDTPPSEQGPSEKGPSEPGSSDLDSSEPGPAAPGPSEPAGSQG